MPIDYKKYPPNWKTEIRPKVLERAKHKCEFCGIENYSHTHSFKDAFGKTVWKELSIGEWYAKDCPKLVKVILTIAHLDHDEDNYEVKLSRLAALCQLCHLQYDAKEKQRRSLCQSKSKA